MNKTNTARAIRAEKALAQYQLNLGDTETATEFTREVVAGFLSDLRHACDKNDVNFYEAVDLAKQHVHDERCGFDNYLDEPDAYEEFPFTVVLLYPDYMNESGTETYSWSGHATDLQTAIEAAQADAVAAQDEWIEHRQPDDFAVLAALEGICKFLI
jgi:hypothetical protein